MVLLRLGVCLCVLARVLEMGLKHAQFSSYDTHNAPFAPSRCTSLTFPGFFAPRLVKNKSRCYKPVRQTHVFTYMEARKDPPAGFTMYYVVPCRTRLRREALQTIYVLQLILRVAAVHGVCRRVVMFADTTRAQEASRVRLDPSKRSTVLVYTAFRLVVLKTLGKGS